MLLPEEPPKHENPKKELDPKYTRLKTIRTNPKQVVLKSVETGDEIIFPSLYINQSPRIITFMMEEFGIINSKLGWVQFDTLYTFSII